MSENDAASPAPDPKKKVKKRRTWKQRLKIIALALVIGVLLFRLGLSLLLPTVVRKVANAYDLDCTFDRMSLGLLGGNAHIWNLALRPKSGGDSIVRADYIQGSVSTPNLFRGRLVVYRAEVDGVEMLIDREPDGSIPLLKRFLSPPAEAPIAVKPRPSATTQPVNLQAPLRIDAVRLSHVKTTFRDRSVSPLFETTVYTSLRLSDIGSGSDAPARFELQVQADPVLDTLTVNGVMRNTPTSVDADLSVLLRGLHPKPAAEYLLPLGVRPLADNITVQARAKLTANVIPNTSDVSATLAVQDVSAVVDNAQWASLKTLSLDAKKLNASAIELGQLLIETGRASARRSSEGRLQVAGFELVPATQTAKHLAAPAPPPPSAPSPRTTPANLRLALDELRLADLQATFDDRAVQSAGEIAARIDLFTARDIVYDPATPDAAIALDGSASLPGVVESIKWAGTVQPFAAHRKMTLKVRADGIKPDRLHPYFDALGVQSQLNAGSFSVEIEASHTDENRMSARVSNFRFTDGQSVLVALASAELAGLSIRPSDGAVHVQAIDLAGPTLTLRRESDGAWAALGLRSKSLPAGASVPPSPATSPANAPATASAPPGLANLPRLQIDRVSWRDIGLTVEDRQGVDAPIVLRGQAGLEASDLVIDPAADPSAAKPGRFNAWLELPGVAERLTISGSLQSAAEGAAINADFNGQGITGAAIASYLKPRGIEMMLKDGRVRGKAGATLALKDGSVRADFQLNDTAYTDGEQELAGLDALRIAGVTLKPGDIAVDLVQITKPRGRVARNADGALETAGVRLVAPPPTAQPAVVPPVTPAAPPPLKLLPPPIALAIKQLRLEDGALHVADRAVSPAVNTVVQGSIALDDARLGEQNAKLKVSGRIAGIVENAGIDGTLSLATDAPGAKLVITAEKIRGDALAGYLPAGTRSTLRDGYFAMTLDAALANHPQGGLAGHLAVRDLLLAEKADNATLAKVGAFTLRVGRLDPAGALVAIDEISSSGLEMDVVRRPDGAMDALGLRVGDSSQPAAASRPVRAPATQPEVVAVAATQPAVDVAALVADARRALPLITVGKIDLRLDRLRMSGLAAPDAAPLDARVRLHNTGPVELGGENADQRPPLKLRIDGAIDPVMKQLAIAIEAALFAAEPAVTVDVSASGINGKGLTDIVPALATQIEGQGLTEGTFTSRLTASMNYGRRGPRDLDVGRGFTAAFNVQPVEFRARPGGPVLAGLEAIRGEDIGVQPRTGNIVVKSIEVIRPIGRFVRDDQGLHALGLVLPLKNAEPADVAAAPITAAPAADAVPSPGPSTTAQRPASELRVDRFTVTGIDVLFEDRTSTPPTFVPLKTFDLEVRNVSNQMQWTGRPVQFYMLCTSDKVPLPPRKGASGPTTQPGGMEMRELFSQITASGRIGIKQTDAGRTILTGWAKTSVNGFELLGVRGLAQAQKVTIGGGVFDDSNDIRFKDDGTIETRNRVVLTNLSLSEAADGPLQRTLKLPSPIDVAIAALKDADDSITMNLPVTIQSGEVDVGKTIAPAIAAISQVLVTAIASAPIKVVGGVGEMIGLGGKDKEPEQPVALTFLPGMATLEPAQAHRLAALAERMRRDSNLQIQVRHEMSSADVAHAQRRANPPVEDVRVMIDRLRRAKSQLLAERAVLAVGTRAQFAAQAKAASESVETLRSIDRQLTRIDASLEHLGDLLRPGAATQADRRTRAAALAVAQERLNVIQVAIADAHVPDAANRVRRTNPQFEATETLPRGRVVITLVPKKK